MRHHVMVDNVLYVPVTTGENVNERIRKIKRFIELADGQYMGCGGNLSDADVVRGMRSVLNDCLSYIESSEPQS